ncbi:unnamed protein product, partial [marine sediment metagenome]
MRKLLIIIIFILISPGQFALALIGGGHLGGCAVPDCGINNALFIWECNDPTVGDIAFCPYGCSDGDSEATVNNEVSIADGKCIINDAGSNGGDNYRFDVSGDNLADDQIGTIFIKFTITTWAANTRLWTLLGQNAEDLTFVALRETDEIIGSHEGQNAGAETVFTSDANLGTGTPYIVRYQWDTNEASYDNKIHVFDAVMAEQGTGDEDNDTLTEFDT